MIILRSLLFKPYLEMRAQRRRKIEGAEQDAEQMQRRAAQLDTEYQQRFAKARATAEEERTRLQAEGRAREGELLAQAREKSHARLQTTRQQLATQVAAVQAELQQRAEPLAHQLASKLLGREV